MAAVDTTSVNGDIKFTIGVDGTIEDAFDTDNLQDEVMHIRCAYAIHVLYASDLPRRPRNF